ncbi:MAG: hypothetical protein V4819_18600 [Verrucomicrobiota bacterium]
MIVDLTPLPDLTQRPAPPVVKSPPWSRLPSPLAGEPAAHPLSSSALPPLSVEDTAASPVIQPSWLSPVPSAAPSAPTSGKTPSAVSQGGIVEPEETEFTDADLIEAFAPIVEHAVHSAVYTKENVIDTYLEPMLRATIRRALAESTPGSRPFHPPGAMDRFLWHLQALFTSRTYEDIFFEKTHRFQIGEVFLVDAASLALVSYASCDPARHSSPRRVESSVQRLALQLRDESGKLRDTFELPDQRHVITRAGRFVTLMAVVRGQPSDLVIADLEFALRRIEDRFRDQFEQKGSALLYTLQPFLEECLLIQAPASAA